MSVLTEVSKLHWLLALQHIDTIHLDSIVDVCTIFCAVKLRCRPSVIRYRPVPVSAYYYTHACLAATFGYNLMHHPSLHCSIFCPSPLPFPLPLPIPFLLT